MPPFGRVLIRVGGRNAPERPIWGLHVGVLAGGWPFSRMECQTRPCRVALEDVITFRRSIG